MKKAAKKRQKRSVDISSITKKAHGLSKLMILVVIAVGLIGVGGIYFFNQKNKLVKPGLNASCKHNDPDLCKFMNNRQVHRDVVVKSTSSSSGESDERLIEVSYGNKNKASFHDVQKMKGKEVSNSIFLDDTNYVLDYSDNTWWREKISSDEAKLYSDSSIDSIDFESKYKFIAKEACENRKCFKYEMIFEDTEFGNFKQFIWFDDWDYLLRKIYIEIGEFTLESSYFYNTVKISAPSPVKDGKPLPKLYHFWGKW